MTDSKSKSFRIRTITLFVNIPADGISSRLDEIIRDAVAQVSKLREGFTAAGYEVQTVRLASNPFPEWLSTPESTEVEQTEILVMLAALLEQNKIDFMALGPASTRDQLSVCRKIVATSGRFSCSVSVGEADVDLARAAAETILHISQMSGQPFLDDGLGNFRFCVAAAAKPYIPFFPVAKAGDDARTSFAIGLENGAMANEFLRKCATIGNILTQLPGMLASALMPVQDISRKMSDELGIHFRGIDSSFNPSLDETGSVAAAIETLEEVHVFGGHGTLAAAAAITKSLQSIPGVQNCGYSGLMLPLCEDRRLAQLAGQLRVIDLLNVSQVCGVGVDTVPVAGDTTQEELMALILDVTGIAFRWGKSLSCRVFPVPGKRAGEMTSFDSPYLVNAKILSLS